MFAKLPKLYGILPINYLLTRYFGKIEQKLGKYAVVHLLFPD